MLLPTSGHDAEHPLDKSAARLAAGAAAALAPKHRMTQHALGVVVRRLDPFELNEGNGYSIDSTCNHILWFPGDLLLQSMMRRVRTERLA